MCALNLKLEQMEAELQDLNSQESKDEASLAKVKKQLRDLEAKVKDQEEELDEQAGTIQMLEQVHTHMQAHNQCSFLKRIILFTWYSLQECNSC